MSKACTTLDEVLKILAVVDSPLYKLKSRVDGVKLAAEQNELKRFLKSHEKLIRSLVVPPHAVSEALRLLEQEIKVGGSTAIDNPETLDSAELLDALSELKDLFVSSAKTFRFCGKCGNRT